MEPLSPRSPNIPPKSKNEPTKSTSNKPAPTEKQHHQKDYALAPPSRIREPGKDGELYVAGEFLGKGGFAVCYEGKLERNNRVFAMKVVKSEMQQKKMQDKFRTELQIHSKMRHPNIVAFHRAFCFAKNTYVVLELCSNGSVMDMVKRRKCISLPEVRRLTIQLCGAVKYLHKRNVAHRDLKMGNMFLDHNMNIKVGDFGLAAIVLSERDEKRRKTLCGTPNYIAPEVLDKSKGGHNQKVDIWSIGVIFFAMLSGYPPFQSNTQEEIYKKVKNLSYAWPKEKESGNHIPSEAKSLVRICLSLDETQRPEPDEIADHPFFNMYPGCIPRQLESECRHTRPSWIKQQDPRGDNTYGGCSLENDARYSGSISEVRTWEERYNICKDKFYTECGVGRNPMGVPRKSAGKRCSKTAYAECVAEEGLGLQPLMPLPRDRVYSYHALSGRDWSVPETDFGNDSTSSTGEDEEQQDNEVASKIQAAKDAKMQQALAAQLRRKDVKPKSHAATLRQPGPSTRSAARDATTRNIPPSSREQAQTTKSNESTRGAPAQNLLSDGPIRTRGRVASAYQGWGSDRAAPKAGSIPKSESVPVGLPTGRTRAQSRQQSITQPPEQSFPRGTKTHDAPPVKTNPKNDDDRISALSKGIRDVKLDPRETPDLHQRVVPSPQKRGPNARQPEKQEQRVEPKAEDKPPANSNQKSRSTLGLGPLIHPEEEPEIMAGTSVNEVMSGLRAYLSEFRKRQDPRISSYNRTRRRQQQNPQPLRPHPYVVKWVDYTNRYGIGYVLDDGSVGCIFRGEHGRPPTCVLLRDGEKHIRRKARAREHPEGPHVYSECGQLVPRMGRPVEFYENIHLDTGLRQGGGVRRVLVPPDMFEVRHINVAAEGARPHTTQGVQRPKCEAEKVKRVKLVDQFGKYMIGSLGRGGYGDNFTEDGKPASGPEKGPTGPYVKFYQRLGNVGVWGFGDGAFQFNFPDHTKVIISLSSSQPTSSSTRCQIDFYHLSPSAARYLSSYGKMHPTGFDTRSGVSEDASVYFAALSGDTECKPTSDITPDRLREVLEANSFGDKMDFLEDVLTTWMRNGRLGGKITSVFSRYSSRAVSNGSSTSTATTRSNGTGSTRSTVSTAPTSVSNSPTMPTGSPSDETELFWDGSQEKSWESSSGGKFVWVSVGAQGDDAEYMSAVLKGPAGSGDVQCVGVDSQEELKRRLKALAS